ncbi:MAG: LysE family transporter [Bacteroidia bacterium]|nr:LysE family transporter [Bacteroidia bacterium]
MAGNKPTKLRQRFEASGFRRGMLLSLLNPMAIPFWIGITAFLESRGWIELSAPLILHSYLAGVVVGALALLMCLAYAAQRLSHSLQHRPWIKKIPGFTLLALGIYAFIDYLF